MKRDIPFQVRVTSEIKLDLEQHEKWWLTTGIGTAVPPSIKPSGETQC